MRKSLIWQDFIILAGVIIMSLAGILFSLNAPEGSQIVISTPFSNYRYPLKEDRIIQVNGVLGDYSIEIKSGKVHTLHSNCPQQVCVVRGWAYKSGDSIACLPNRILIKIEDKNQVIDAVTE